MPLGALDRSHLRSQSEYADIMVAALADVEADLAEYRVRFGRRPPRAMVARLDVLKASLREAKADVARLSQQDAE